MSDLVEFLHARLDEDEAVARAAPPEDHFYLLPDAGYDLTSIGPGWVMAVHPARVLREVAAKRAIISQADEASNDRGRVISEFCCSSKEIDDSWATDPGALILLALASVYSDHADYDPAWSPDGQP